MTDKFLFRSHFYALPLLFCIKYHETHRSGEGRHSEACVDCVTRARVRVCVRACPSVRYTHSLHRPRFAPGEVAGHICVNTLNKQLFPRLCLPLSSGLFCPSPTVCCNGNWFIHNSSHFPPFSGFFLTRATE